MRPSRRKRSHQPPCPRESNQSDAKRVTTAASSDRHTTSPWVKVHTIPMTFAPYGGAALSNAGDRKPMPPTIVNSTATGSQASTRRPRVTLKDSLRSPPLVRGHVSRPAQSAARPCGGELAVLEHLLTVHVHVGDADGRLVRVVEGRAVRDRRWIEHGDVGGHPRLQEPAIVQSHALGRERSHLAHGELQRDELQVTHVVP